MLIKKLSVLVLTFAVTLTLGASATFAQVPTQAELEAAGFSEAEIALFMSLTGGSTTTTTSSTNRGCDVDYLRDLSMGATGADVMNLQEFLNDAGFTVSLSGAGSVGMESMYFGAKTKAAVTAFQNANAATILTPIGLTMGTGYFGAGSRSAVRMQCANTTPTTPGEPTNPGDNDGLEGGEASIEDVNVRSGDDDEVEEGQSGEVSEIEFDVEDGDVRISRLDLKFVGTGDEQDPWDTFDTITLLDEDGDELASESVDDEDDWLNEDDGIFRFSGLDYVVREGDMGMIVVEVEVQNSVDGTDDGESWTLTVAQDAIRGVDSVGIQQYNSDSSDSSTFEVVEEGEGEELNVKSSSDDPDASTIAVDEDSRSGWFTVFIHELEAEDNDIEIETLGDYTVTVTGDVYNQVVNDVRVMVDGEEFDDATVTNPATAAADISFDIDKDYTLDADETVNVEFQVRFNKLTGNYTAGQTVQVSIAGAGTDGEGADDVTATGDVDGETHTLRVSGLFATADRTDHTSSVTTKDGAANDFAVFNVVFDVTAFEEDVYIPKTTEAIAATAAESTSTITNGFVYSVENGQDGDAANEGTPSAIVSSGADTEGAYYVVREGETESFTLKVTVTPAAGNTGANYNVQLRGVHYNETTAAPADTRYEATPEQDFESPAEFVSDDTV